MRAARISGPAGGCSDAAGVEKGGIDRRKNSGKDGGGRQGYTSRRAPGGHRSRDEPLAAVAGKLFGADSAADRPRAAGAVRASAGGFPHAGCVQRRVLGAVVLDGQRGRVPAVAGRDSVHGGRGYVGVRACGRPRGGCVPVQVPQRAGRPEYVGASLPADGRVLPEQAPHSLAISRAVLGPGGGPDRVLQDGGQHPGARRSVQCRQPERIEAVVHTAVLQWSAL